MQTTTTIDDRIYRYSPDESTQGALAVWTIVFGRVLDEITGAPPKGQLWIRVTESGLRPHVGSDGLIGLLVEPLPRYPLAYAPGLVLHVTIGADRYLPRHIEIPIARVLTSASAPGQLVLALDSHYGIAPGQRWILGDWAGAHETLTVAALGPDPLQIILTSALANVYPATTTLLPDTSTQLALDDIALHRAPVMIHGRVMAWSPAATKFEPVEGAAITVPGMWRRQADVTTESAMEVTNLVSLSPGLYRNRVAGTDALQPLTETVVAGDQKLLVADAALGDTRLKASNARGLVPGSLLRLENEHAEARETIEVVAVELTGTVNDTALVGLRQALRIAHRRGATVEHVTTIDTLTPKTLQTDGVAGDLVAFLADLTWSAAPTIARLGSGADAEYQRVGLLTATTNADGYFALPPISRVVRLKLVVITPTGSTQEVYLQPDYQSLEQQLDISFS